MVVPENAETAEVSEDHENVDARIEESSSS